MSDGRRRMALDDARALWRTGGTVVPDGGGGTALLVVPATVTGWTADELDPEDGDADMPPLIAAADGEVER